jgi:hypothetical protein
MTTALDPAGTDVTLETGESLTVYRIYDPGTTGGDFIQQSGSAIYWEDSPGAGFYPQVIGFSSASGTIDLRGATLGLLTNDVLSTFLITDTSASHDGDVTGLNGAGIVFQDFPGAGFDPAATAISVSFTGRSALRDSLRSESLSPTNRWTMPAPTTSLVASYTDFRGYVLSFLTGSGWSINNFNTFENALPPSSSPYSFWLYWLNQAAYLETWTGVIDENGFRVYGPPAVIACRINSNPVQQLDAQGNILTVPTTMLVSETSTATVNDRVTLPDGTQHLITKVKDTPGPTGTLVFKEVSLL